MTAAAQSIALLSDKMMTSNVARDDTLHALDPATRHLVRLAAIVSGGTEGEVRSAVVAAYGQIPDAWVEELLLQTYLFAGFPRALNAMREWRRVCPVTTAEEKQRDEKQIPRGVYPEERERRRARDDSAGDGNAGVDKAAETMAAGEKTCAEVYGEMYDKLRENIRGLHPLLDEWMIVEGYGKVLSRPELDLGRRELCIVAACAATNQDRQLHSHLHGALNVGVAPAAVGEAIDSIADVIGVERAHAVRMLWSRVRGK